MEKRKIAGFFMWLLPVLEAVCILVFALALARDWGPDEYEWFEQAARILGYVMILAANLLSTVSAYNYRRGGALGKSGALAMKLILASLFLLCVHDVLLFEAYGNQLEGTFTMAAFFVLDACLVLSYLAALYLRKKAPEHRAGKALWLVIALLWLLYMIADSAGYPISHIYDWDEAALKLPPACNALLLFFCRFPLKNK